jgi:hypothetical protein
VTLNRLISDMDRVLMPKETLRRLYSHADRIGERTFCVSRPNISGMAEGG